MTARGRLLLVPNTLDHGAPPVPLAAVLPDGVIAVAATLSHWVVEDARSARAFLKRVAEQHALARPLQQLDIRELPRPRKGGGGATAGADLAALLQPALAGADIGLLSEAGLPGVADPGAELVAQAHAAGVPVLPLPGASALLLTLAASGLNGQRFAFVGYLPQDAAARTQQLRELESQSRQHALTQIVIETPYRNNTLLQALLLGLAPTTRLAVGCGLTLPEGFVRSGTVAQWRQGAPVLPDRLPAVFAFLGAR